MTPSPPSSDPAEPDVIGIEGTEKLCEDLGIEPTDVAALVLAYHLGCEHMCEFKRAAWVAGWSRMR